MPCRKDVLDHKETEVSNEVQLIERYEALHRKAGGLTDNVHTTSSLAILVVGEAILASLDRLRETLDTEDVEDIEEDHVVAGFCGPRIA